MLVVCFLLMPNRADAVGRDGDDVKPKKNKAVPSNSGKPKLSVKISTVGTGGGSNQQIGVVVSVGATGIVGNTPSGPPRRSHSFSHVCAATGTVPNPMLLHWEMWEPDGGTDAEGKPTFILRTYEHITLRCGNGVYEVTVCTNNCPAGTPPAPPPPDPYELALVLAESLNFHVPEVTLSPALSGDAKVLVGMPFFWSVPEVQFETLRLTGTACNGLACVSSWVQATPEFLYFAPGDGNETVTTCRRTGDVVRSRSQAVAAGDDCQYTYDVAGTHDAAVGLHYGITGGQINGPTFVLEPQDSEVTLDVPVWEFQPVIVG